MPRFADSTGCFMRSSMLMALIVVSWAAIVLSRPVRGSDEAFFVEYIEPLLKQHCYECHSHATGDASGGLVLDSKAGWTVAAIQGQP